MRRNETGNDKVPHVWQITTWLRDLFIFFSVVPMLLLWNLDHADRRCRIRIALLLLLSVFLLLLLTLLAILWLPGHW